PSHYLQTCCPACFGDTKPILDNAHVLVCLDANFTQKCLQGKYNDPTLVHPQSLFILEADLRRMEDTVESIRGKKTGPKLKMKTELPDEVLDECEKSFIAVQEKIAKVSSKLYVNTGLVALSC
ncbi:hypothetical protein M422DRAFT_86089, partial [Sphaerobolus stellatus SS14]